MSQLYIVTTPQNSGLGTPLDTAFNYTNTNFSELYARYQTSVPTNLRGKTGDVPGMYASDSNYFYYCFGTYNGTSTIWAQVSQVANITLPLIQNGTSNVNIPNINSNVVVGVGGTANVAVFSTTGVHVSGNVIADGNVSGTYILGDGSQLTGLPATYTNSNVTTLLAAFGSNTISTTGTITSGNITGANILTSGVISSTGNIITQGMVSATGNIVTSGYFVGTFFGNVTGNFVVPGSNTQVIFNTSGNADAAGGMTYNKDSNTFTVLGTVSSQGNVIAGNVTTNGLISVAGNITGGNLIATSITGTLATPSQPTITAIGTLGLLSVTGNVQGGNLRTTGIVSATGNITTIGNISGGNISTTDVEAGGNISASRYTGTTISVNGNITGANLRTGGQISATGNITGSYFLGNGSQLSGLPATYSNANVSSFLASFGSNTISTTGTITSGSISSTGNITGTYILGDGSQLTNLPANYTNSNVTTLLAAFGSNNISTTGSITSASTVGGIITGSSVSVSGNVAAAGHVGTVYTNSIVNTGSNATGNIGSFSTYFNTIFATATTALYADLAEKYLADAEYAPGTVVVFGGDKEITVTTELGDERVAGVISTNPAYLMNSGEPGSPVALRGKVPTRVIGPVTKGDSLITSSTPGVAISVGRSRDHAQAVFGKALETNTSVEEKVILVVII